MPKREREPVTGVRRGDGRPWYPIECEHGYDCCPQCDGIPFNPDAPPPPQVPHAR